MATITVLLAAAVFAYSFARWLQLPVVPILLLTGLGISATGLRPETAFLEDALILGITFLVFVAGIELSPRRARTYRRAAFLVGLWQFFILSLFGLVTALLLGYGLTASLYIAVALAASSTLVVVRLLQQRRQMFEPSGRLVLGVLLLQDLLVILVMAMLTRVPDGGLAVILGILAALALLSLAFAMVQWGTPLLVQSELDEETLLLTILAVLFSFIGIALALDLPLVAGAFLAGISLSSFPINGLIRAQLNSISDFFTAIFFTSLGAYLEISASVDLLHGLAFAVVVIVVTPPLVAFVAERSGLSARASIEAGLLLSQTSEFSLVIGLQALVLELISPSVFTVIALVTVLTMILTPFISTRRVVWRLVKLHPLMSREQVSHRFRGHILLLGCGENGMPLLETLLLSGHDVVVVDDDPAVIDELRQNEVPCIRGDGSDLQVLEAAGAGAAQVIISTIRRPTDNKELLRHVRDVPVLVRTYDSAEADMVSALGGIPILYSAAGADAFIAWFERRFGKSG